MIDRSTEALEEFLSPYPLEVQQTVLQGRKILLERFASVTEFWYDATAAVCVGIGYSPKPSDLFLNFAAYAKHVNLVFHYGATLNDSHKLLVGEGSRIRHIKLKSHLDLLESEVLDLIDQAAESAPRPSKPVDPVLVVKIYEGVKRRPNASG